MRSITKKERYKTILDWFLENVPIAESELNYQNAFQLLIAVILSAQCTDKRVNIVTPALFQKYPTPETLATSTFEEVFELIKSISFPNNKAKHLLGMAKKLVYDFHSEIPSEVDQLETLPGVGRKTANVIASVIFNKPVIAVDTHVFRVSRRIGLSKGNTVEKVEADLTKNIPEHLRAISHHWLILHGRYVCMARKPKCSECGISAYCSLRQSTGNNTITEETIFILNRTHEKDYKSTGKIVLYGFLFWIVTRMIIAALTHIAFFIYDYTDTSPLKAVAERSSSAYDTGSLGWLLMVILISPLQKEIAFRLGLSFRRWHVALSIGFLCCVIASFFLPYNITGWIIKISIILFISALSYYLLTENTLTKAKANQKLIIWVTAISYGLIPLLHIKGYSLVGIPYMLINVLSAMAFSFTYTYYRINLNFWWGLGMHMLPNIPSAIITMHVYRSIL